MSAEVGGSTDGVDSNAASQAGTQGAENPGADAASTPASADGAAVPKLELEGVSVGGVNPDDDVEEVGEKPEHLLEDAKESKDRGNACFGESNWKSAALEYHSACLLLNRVSSDHPDASDETKAAARALMVVCLTNLAQSQLHMGIADGAYKSTSMAVALDPTAFKAFYHKSRAEEELGDVNAAYASIVKAVKLKPKNKTMRKRFEALKKQKARETRMVQNAFKGFFAGSDGLGATKDSPVTSTTETAPAAEGGTGAGVGAGAGAGGADGSVAASGDQGDDDDSSGSDSDYTSSSGDGAYQEDANKHGSDADSGDEVEYSDAAAYQKALDMGIPAQQAGMMVARGEGPLLFSGYKSVAQYEESVRIKAQREEWDRERRQKRARRKAKKAAALAQAQGGD